MSGMRVIGLSGWSGAGKTTLLIRVIPVLVSRGLRVATVKHAHHDFDTDCPGKDSYEHRKAGASEVVISSGRRWAIVHELRDEPEANLGQLLGQLLGRTSACDLVVVEGFKREAIPKIEVYRAANGRPPLHPHDGSIVAVASDTRFDDAGVPVVALDDAEAIAMVMRDAAKPIDAVLRDLGGQTARRLGDA